MIKYASMQLEGWAYNWYMWWKITTKKGAHNWKTFKKDFFKRFEDLKENDFFANITRLQQKGDMDEYTAEWEELTTHVLKLKASQ